VYKTNKTNDMTEQMINTVNERVSLMVKDPKVQEIMMTFENNDDAHNWLIKAAIATLIGVQND
jgi:hypothetical protein